LLKVRPLQENGQIKDTLIWAGVMLG